MKSVFVNALVVIYEYVVYFNGKLELFNLVCLWLA